MSDAAGIWRDELAAWAIPEPILAAAPESPWGFPVELFHAEPLAADSPSRTRALERLPAGGSVLDVGSGGGSASFALVPPAGLVVGVDSSKAMLRDYAKTATARSVEHRELLGTWPEIAAHAPVVDVVVCHHVFYNVPDLGPFVAALSAHARRRVVVELTDRHPLSDTASLWQYFHGITRPDGPTAELATQVLVEAGLEVHTERWTRPPRAVPREVYVRLNRRRLCLPESAEREVDHAMGSGGSWTREVVTMWWDTQEPVETQATGD